MSRTTDDVEEKGVTFHGLQYHDEETGWLFSLGFETCVEEQSEYRRGRGESDRRVVILELGFWSLAWSWAIKHRARGLDRCECGHLIWPWQKSAVDSDLGMLIHASCGDPEVRW